MQTRHPHAASAALLAFVAFGGCALVDATDDFNEDELAIKGGSVEDNANFPWVVHVSGRLDLSGESSASTWRPRSTNCEHPPAGAAAPGRGCA